MKLYCNNQIPFVYTAFSDRDKERVIPVLESINESGVSFWFSGHPAKKEKGRIEAAFSFILFVSNNSIADEKVLSSIEYAIMFNKKILCIYLEQTVLSNGLELELNSLQSINIFSYSDESAFLEKLKSAEVFSGMKITGAQKSFAKRRALVSVMVPVVSALVIFFAVVYPLLIVPAIQAANGALSKLGFGNLSLDELAKVSELYVIGNRAYDQWYGSDYLPGTKKEVYFNGDRGNTVPVGDISDISDLALLKNAKTIAFQANKVKDISPLYGIQSLESLTVSCNPIRSIEGIESLKNLKEAIISSTDVSDISPLFKIRSLEYISFRLTYVSSIEGIENLPNLRGIATDSSNLKDISPLNKMDFSYINDPSLPGFEFSAQNTQIRDFSPLQRIPRFTHVLAEVKRADDILPYISGKEVNKLGIINSDIKSIDQLASFKYVSALYLERSEQLTSVDGIEQLAGLEYLNIMYCPKLTDLTPLLTLPNFQVLIISDDMADLASAQLAGAAFQIKIG